MKQETRQYRLVRLTVIGFGVGSLVALLAVTAQQWLSIWPMLQPQVLGCGCQSVVVQISPWISGFASMLLATSGILLGRFVWFSLSRIVRQERMARDLLKQNDLQIDVSTGISYVVMASDGPQAMTVGIRQPQIVVTEQLLERLTEPELSAVLRHEQAHQHSADPLWSIVLESIGAAWFWLPWLRTWVTAAFRLRELAADESAVRSETEQDALGNALLKLSEQEPAMIPTFSANRDRVEKLLDRAWRPRLRLWRWPTVLSGLAVTAGLVFFHQIGTVTAEAVATVPAGVCQETEVMCEQPSHTATSGKGVCFDQGGWQCLFVPAMTTYGLQYTPR